MPQQNRKQRDTKVHYLAIQTNNISLFIYVYGIKYEQFCVSTLLYGSCIAHAKAVAKFVTESNIYLIYL